MKALSVRCGEGRLVDVPLSRVVRAVARAASPSDASSYGTPPPPSSPLPDTYLMTSQAAAAAARRQMHSAS